MRILLVEDEIKTSRFIQKGLSENGFVVDVAACGEDGLHLALVNHYDLIILDILLPNLDGWSILVAFRQKDSQTPVMFLTARDAVADRVRGLEQGADDYLVKPFAFSELLARLRTLLRRRSAPQSETFWVGDLELDPVRCKAMRGKLLIHLTAKEFLLLSLLVRRSGEVLSRTLIAEQVWDMNFDSNTNVVDVAVRRLRRKMDEPFSIKLIHTVRGLGYVLEER